MLLNVENFEAKRKKESSQGKQECGSFQLCAREFKHSGSTFDCPLNSNIPLPSESSTRAESTKYKENANASP